MQLSDHDLIQSLACGEITVSPIDAKDIQPASVDLHLGNDFVEYRPFEGIIDTKEKQDEYMFSYTHKNTDYITIPPHGFLLACTKETIGVDNAHAAQLTGKSSLARMGLIIHTTAGFIDPGNSLVPTLELYNCNSRALRLYIGQPIGQVIFTKLLSPCKKEYGHADRNSKYLNSTTTEASKNYKNF